jgi:hypothetical protein
MTWWWAPCLLPLAIKPKIDNRNRDTHADQNHHPTTNTPKNTDDELRDDWDARIENAQRRAFKRRHAAAMDEPDIAKRDALWARLSAPRHCWFSAELEPSVTEQAPLVIECLDDLRARAKRRPAVGRRSSWPSRATRTPHDKVTRRSNWGVGEPYPGPQTRDVEWRVAGRAPGEGYPIQKIT